MKPRCEFMLSEHTEAGATRCEHDPEHTAALVRRRGGAPKWSPIVRGTDTGGERDHLENKPINCGRGLLLQVVEHHDDDYGGYTLAKDDGVRVRYEMDGRRIVLYVEIGGHSARLEHNEWMRFHWPEPSRIFE